ncbi:MAG: ImmA/IrrE family metallo-endopeptidase [Limnochordia bacterium]|jgi:Zn-dependent peptidase ImmA (M78 family)
MNEIESIASFRANEVRKRLGLSAFEAMDIIKTLRENEDVSFVLKPFESGISGMFLRLGNAKVIVLNTTRTLGHQRFTAAHEYYHLCFDTEMTGGICLAGTTEQKVTRELEADLFAANLLMPRDGLEISLFRRTQGRRDLTIDDVVSLEQKFGVSRMAMLVRLRQLGYLTEPQFCEMKGLPVIRSAKILGYATDLYEPTAEEAVFSSYAEKAKLALEWGRISEGRYRQLLREAGLIDLLYGEEVEPTETV